VTGAAATGRTIGLATVVRGTLPDTMEGLAAATPLAPRGESIVGEGTQVFV
jgi:hypothetical protein